MSNIINNDALTINFLVAKIESLLVRMQLAEDRLDIYSQQIPSPADLQQIRVFPGNLVQLNDRIDQFYFDFADTSDQIIRHEEQIAQLYINQGGGSQGQQEIITQIQTSIDLLDRNQTTLQTTIGQLDARITTVNDSFGLMHDYISDTIRPELDEHMERIQAIAGRFLDMDMQIQQIKGTLNADQQAIQLLIDQNGELAAKQNTQEARIITIDSSVRSQYQLIDQISDKTSQLNSTVSNALAKTVQLDQTITQIQQKNDQQDMEDTVQAAKIQGLIQVDLDLAYQQLTSRLASLEENYAFTKFAISQFMNSTPGGGVTPDGQTPANVILQFATINDQIVDLTSKFTTLNTKHHLAVEFNATTFATFDARITAAQGEITRDNIALGTISQRVTVLEQYGSSGSGNNGSGMTAEQYQAITSQLDTINASINTVSNNMTDTRIRLGAVEFQLGNLQTNYNDTESDLGKLEVEVGRIKLELTDLKLSAETPVSLNDFRVTQALTELIWYYMADIDFATTHNQTVNDSHNYLFNHLVVEMHLDPEVSTNAVGRYMYLRGAMGGRFFLPKLYQQYNAADTINSYVQFLFHQQNEIDIGLITPVRSGVVSDIDSEYNRLHTKIVQSNDASQAEKDNAEQLKLWLANFKSAILTNQNRSKQEADMKVDNVENTVTTQIVRVNGIEESVNQINTTLANLNYNPSQVAQIALHDDMIKLIFSTLFNIDMQKASGQSNWEVQMNSVRAYINALPTNNTSEKQAQIANYDKMMQEYSNQVTANAKPVYEQILLQESTNQTQHERISVLEQLTMTLGGEGGTTNTLQQLLVSTLEMTDNQLMEEVSGSTPMTFRDFRKLIYYYQLRPADGVVFVTSTNLDIVLGGYLPRDGNEVTLSTLTQYVRNETLALNYTTIADTNNLASNIADLQTAVTGHVNDIGQIQQHLTNIDNTLYTLQTSGGNVDLTNYYTKSEVDTRLLSFQMKPIDGAFVNANDLTMLLQSYVTKTDDLNAYATKDFVLANYLKIGDALGTYVTVPVFEQAIAGINTPDLTDYVTLAYAEDNFVQSYQLDAYSTTASTNTLLNIWTPKGYNQYTNFLEWTQTGIQQLVDSFGEYTIQDPVTTAWPTSYSVVPTKLQIETYFAQLISDLQAGQASTTFMKTGYVKCPDIAASYAEPFTISCKGAITAASYIYSDTATNNISVVDMTWNACPNGDYWYPIFILTDLKQGSNDGTNKLPNAYRYLGTYATPTLIRGSLTKTGCKVAIGELPSLWTTELALTVVLIANSDAVTFGMDALVSGQDALSAASVYM